MNSVAAVPLALCPLLLNSLRKSLSTFPSVNSAGLPRFSFFPRVLCSCFSARLALPRSCGWEGRASPCKAAGAWWTVWGTLADTGGLAFPNPARKSSYPRSPRAFASRARAQRHCLLRAHLSVLPSRRPLVSRLLYHSWQAPMALGEAWGRHLPLWGVL
jgi:hypothetical protein